MQPKPELRLVRPPLENHPVSIEFMHRKLAESGLVPEDVNAYPVAPSAAGEGAFLIPYDRVDMYRIRYDRKENKYKQPKSLIEVWWSPHHDIADYANHSRIYIIEGELKAASFVKKFGLPTFGIGGCWNFRDKTGASPRLLAEIKTAIRRGTEVHVIFDGDIETNTNVQQAAHSLANLIDKEYGKAVFFKPPLGKGVDDWLMADPMATLDHLTPISIVELADSRKQLYEQLDCLMDEGKLILNEENACRLIKYHYKDNLRNDRRLGIVVEGEVTNDVDRLCDDALSWLQRNINPRFAMNKVQAGFRMALRDFSGDLLQVMLKKGAELWDGVPRLDTWAEEIFETTFPAYTREWGRILMTGMGLRILQPGTKHDYTSILAGPQGIGKSTFFEELATFEGNRFYSAFTALNTSEGDSDRTQAIKLQRAVIVDLAEGVVFETRKDRSDALKQFISQTSDEYREVYARTVRQIDRGFVFVGTTNRRDQLGDQTGSRRYINIYVTRIKRLPYATKLQILYEVAAKEYTLRNQEWWRISVAEKDIPDFMRNEDNEHIKDVQLLVNQQFQRADAASEIIENIIESGLLAKFKATGQYFITSTFITSQMRSEGDLSSKNLLSRSLAAMSSSPTARYSLELKRIRMPQLDATEKQQQCYLDGITNNQAMIVGYLVTKKT